MRFFYKRYFTFIVIVETLLSVSVIL